MASRGKTPWNRSFAGVLDLIADIEYDPAHRKPLVAIFGDLYVRDNEVMNQDLVRAIEEAGGEALITPYHDYTKIIIENMFRRAYAAGRVRGDQCKQDPAERG